MQSIFAIVASANEGEPIIGVIAFAIAGWWVYFKMDKRDKDHEIKLKEMDQKNEK